MNGQNTRMKSSSGRTSQIAVASGRSSAIHFGASSPNTISAAVMIAKAIVTAMLCAVATASCAGRNESAGSKTDASAGSAIQPRPRLAMVMPSWVAAM